MFLDPDWVLITILGILELANADIFQERRSSIFPADYDKYKPPWKEGHPAHVYVTLMIMDIDRIDDGKMEFSLQLFISEEWKDDRLNLTIFTEDVYELPIFPTVLEQHLWKPDLMFDNSRDGKLFQLTLPNTDIKVLKSGILKKEGRYNLIIGCPMDFHFYPMDTQKCYLKISSLSNPDSKLLLHWAEEEAGNENIESIMLMEEIHPLKYELHEPVIYKITEVWDDGSYTVLYANFTFVRRLSASVFNVYIPSTVVVFLSWISFWVDIEAVPARVTLGVTSLLTLGTQMVQARSGLPDISYMTAMDVWLFACLITVSSALLEFAFAYQICLRSKQRPTIDAPIPSVKSTKRESRIWRTTVAQDLSFRNVNFRKRKKESWMKVKETNAKSLDSICRKTFPLLFFLFTLAYWIYYLHFK